MGKSFYEAQEQGYIPDDEPFYHGSFLEPSEDGSGYSFAGLGMPANRNLLTFGRSSLQSGKETGRAEQIPRRRHVNSWRYPVASTCRLTAPSGTLPSMVSPLSISQAS
jgi:hypothetical protein